MSQVQVLQTAIDSTAAGIKCGHPWLHWAAVLWMDEILHLFEPLGDHCCWGIIIPGFLGWCDMDFTTTAGFHFHAFHCSRISCLGGPSEAIPDLRRSARLRKEFTHQLFRTSCSAQTVAPEGGSAPPAPGQDLPQDA